MCKFFVGFIFKSRLFQHDSIVAHNITLLYYTYLQFFGEASLLLGIRRSCSARTKTQCMLYRISKLKLLTVLQDFPDTLVTMKKVAVSRVNRLQHYVSPEKYDLKPEDEVDSEDRKTELFGVDAEEVMHAKAEENSRFRLKSRHSHRHALIRNNPIFGKNGKRIGS